MIMSVWGLALCGYTPLVPGTAVTVTPSDARLIYEGRWEARDGSRVADWPCTGVRLVVESTSDEGAVHIAWRGVRTRILAAVSWASNNSRVSETVLKGSATDWPLWFGKSGGAVTRSSLMLPRGRFTILLRKLTSATPYAMGIGRFFSPSLLEFYGLELDESVKLLAADEHWAPRARIRFIGASDTAGYCVDGTPETSTYETTLNGWSYSNCDSAYPGIVGRKLEAFISVQALAGAGVTQNAFANIPDAVGRLTMAHLLNRTLQTDERVWNEKLSPPNDLVVISLGGNDFNHQKVDQLPSNASFHAAYTSMLDGIFDARRTPAGEFAVAAICGMGSPDEMRYDPNNYRCRPCPHVEDAVKGYKEAHPERHLEYISIPCDGGVVSGQGDMGCAGHKNAVGQGEVADYLVPRLERLLARMRQPGEGLIT